MAAPLPDPDQPPVPTREPGPTGGGADPLPPGTPEVHGSHKGNGHTAQGARKGPVAGRSPPGGSEPLLSPAVAVQRLQRGAEWGAVVRCVCRGVKAGETDPLVARETLLAAYPDRDYDAAFAAAEVSLALLPVPILSPKTPNLTAEAYLRTCHAQGETTLLRTWQEQFYRWDGSAYRLLGERDIEADLDKFLPLGNMPPTTSKIQNVVGSIRRLTHVADAAEPPCWIGAPEPGYPELEGLIPLKGGYLDPLTDTLYPPTPAVFNLSALPFAYDPADARPPERWLRLLDQIWGRDAENNGFQFDPQSIECLQEMFGYLLTTDNRQHKMFMIQGPRRSGKGTIARILTALLGDENVAAPDFEGLSGDHGLQSLRGKTAAILPDVEVGARTDIRRVVGILKNISGADKVTINPKFEAPVITTLKVRFVMLANSMPRFADSSGALAYRFILIKQERSFAGMEDIALTEKILPELPQILHWALAGLKRLNERIASGEGGFIMPDSARDLYRELEEFASPIQAFLNSTCTIGPTETISVDRMWALWCNWSRDQGSKEGTRAWFGRDLRSALPGLKTSRLGLSRTATYCGVGEACEAP